MEWLPLRLWKKQFKVRIGEEGFEVADMDIESEIVAVKLTGITTPHLSALEVLRSILGAKPSREALQVELDRFTKSGKYSTTYTSQMALNVSQSTSPLYLAMAAEMKTIYKTDNETKLLKDIANNPNTHPLTLEKLATRTLQVQQSVAHNPRTPPKVLWKILHKNSNMIIHNPTATTEMLKIIFSDPSFHPKYDAYLFLHPNCPFDIVVQIISQPVGVRTHFAQRTSNLEVLNKLLEDEDPTVRVAALSNRYLSQAEKEKKLSDPAQEVRVAVLNKNISIEAQLVLAMDPDPWVRNHLANRGLAAREIIEYLLANENNQGVLYSLARYNQLTNIECMALARHPQYYVRTGLAGNLKISKEIIEILLNDKNGQVRREVLEKQSLSGEEMLKLEKDKNSMVAKIARSKNWRYRQTIGNRREAAIER